MEDPYITLDILPHSLSESREYSLSEPYSVIYELHIYKIFELGSFAGDRRGWVAEDTVEVVSSYTTEPKVMK